MQIENLQRILYKQFYPGVETYRKNKEIRQLEKDISPYVERYDTEPHTPKLIEDVSNSFWRKAGFGDLDFQCNLTLEEINSIEERGRMIFLLHPDIFEPEGLVKLASSFPWTRDSWITDIDEAKKIKHYSKDGGCFEVEANLSTPVIYALNTEQGLIRKLGEQRRIPQRISTYLGASLFSLIYLGHSFDLNNTSSRLLGSFYFDGEEKKTLSATWNESEKSIEIFFSNVDESSTNLGARTERVHIKTGSHVLAKHHERHREWRNFVIENSAKKGI